MAPLRYAAKFDPFLSLDCAPRPPPWHNPRKGRDQVLPSCNLEGAHPGGHVRPRRSADHEDRGEEGQAGANHQGAEAAKAEVPEHGGMYQDMTVLPVIMEAMR